MEFSIKYANIFFERVVTDEETPTRKKRPVQNEDGYVVVFLTIFINYVLKYRKAPVVAKLDRGFLSITREPTCV